MSMGWIFFRSCPSTRPWIAGCRRTRRFRWSWPRRTAARSILRPLSSRPPFHSLPFAGRKTPSSTSFSPPLPRSACRCWPPAFGGALLIDAHSRPSSASTLGTRDRDQRVDIVLGDNHGEACAPEFTAAAERWFRARGLRVLRNQPYAGGFTTQRYGRPALARHTLQIEINRALYMDEARHERLPTAGVLARLITGLLEEMGQQAQETLQPPRPLAAE
jgi:hypothetical protein